MKRILSIVITAILAGAFAFTGLAPASASPRTGDLQITKECSQMSLYGFCTITSSNLKMIKRGSLVIYDGAANSTGLNTDIVLYAGPGNIAFGHVSLDSANGWTRIVTFNGGTGKFEDFHAEADVSPTGGDNWAWDGTYSFNDD